jgi:heat shock protein HslJ
VAGQTLIGTTWKWRQTLYSNDTKALPSNPDHYTLKLLLERKISIRATCNVGGGVYTLRGSELSIEITHTTMAACPPKIAGAEVYPGPERRGHLFHERWRLVYRPVI